MNKLLTKIDLTSTTIGSLYIIGELEPEIRLNQGKEYWVRFWKCQCVCGNIIKRDQRGLRQKRHHHCGCLHKQLMQDYWKDQTRPIKEGHSRWSGYKEISGRYWGNLYRSAQNRNITFSINIEYIWNLYLLQNEKCNISGLLISFNNRTASLDRIDSSKGYIEGNVQWVHKDINKMKMDFDINYFIKLCSTISNNQRNKNEYL